MPQIRALSRDLRKNPPLHLVVAAALGVKPAPDPVRAEDQDLNALFAAFRAAGGQTLSG
jgi:hypothetical protein